MATPSTNRAPTLAQPQPAPIAALNLVINVFTFSDLQGRNACVDKQTADSILQIVYLFALHGSGRKEGMKIFVKTSPKCNHVYERPV
jgi:hypothetical protein